MSLGLTKPIGAFCILCHDADTVLPFYRDILGFDPRRAEESFYHFAKRGTATSLCLWEIGHVARHTVFDAHPETVIPNKFILSLTLGSNGDVDALYGDLTKTQDVRLLRKPAGDANYGFHFIDPCAVIWEVRASAHAGAGLGLDRITLICQNFPATKSFYETKLAFPARGSTAGRVTYPAIDNTALSLWDATAASETLGLVGLDSQKAQWSANTAMLAYSFDTIVKVQELHDSLGQAGVPFDHAPAYFDWDFSASYFHDPEDNIWELFEVPSNIQKRMLPQTG